jgi:hypothetical protein
MARFDWSRDTLIFHPVIQVVSTESYNLYIQVKALDRIVGYRNFKLCNFFIVSTDTSGTFGISPPEGYYLPPKEAEIIGKGSWTYILMVM